MTETQTVQKFKIEEIDKIPQGNYLVLPMGDSTCIYKLLEGLKPEDHITLNISSSYSRSFLGFSMESLKQITASVGNVGIHNIEWYKNKGQVIHLTTEGSSPVSLKPVKIDTWNIGIEIGKIRISMNNWSYHYSNTLVEDEGKFYVRILGCNFPISFWERTTNLEFYTNALYSAKNLPLKEEEKKNAAILKKIVSKELPEISDSRYQLNKKNCEGISKTLATVTPFLQQETDTLKVVAFKIAAERTKKTINNVKFSVVFNRIFEGVDTQEKFTEKLSEMVDVLISSSNSYNEEHKNYLENLLDYIPEAREVKKAALKRKSTGAFNKIMDDLEFVKIDPVLYPLTHEAVHSGDIPLGTFFRKTGESYFVFNDNWELWEEMLKAHLEEAKQIASTCSGRTTYEKDIMSYFYFVLHKLPDYLERHTGKKWKGIPRVINSSNELDPPKEGSNGVAKTRSALTPIVDNENLTVTVPYVSMHVSGGYGTTYCYGLDYNVLERGFSWTGNTVTRDVEKKLNGRDDYGLMFYTLTGTAQGRGYPSFLIIFENLETNIRVHFHRVHPMRSKGGDYNPVHNWTIGCYKWMIGNVNFERIKAQQGDLAFVEVENLPKDAVTSEVNAYDNHRFETPVQFAPYTKKDNQNVLGYVVLEKETQLLHNEHLNRVIPAGTYEIRQCRSWEANPKGVWSLRID